MGSERVQKELSSSGKVDSSYSGWITELVGSELEVGKRDATERMGDRVGGYKSGCICVDE